MAPPSPLAIATSSVQRLVKEETYYHKELASQQTRVEKLEKDIKEGSKDLDNNAEYVLKQEKQAMEETKNVFGPLRSRITDAVLKLEEQIAISESSAEESAQAELVKAKEVLIQGQKTLNPEA
ncbi:Tubulin-specific chaperone A [Cytospora mali]|uniref:Tubulin-specific chaperone A n=1 Tax=Cytospora mali TaxID=578113 RepID=A0A194UQP2_CYTMA|nr:Tubulin-specific chaperone A [Valsa mali var. pyri (nom. inval.)]